MIDLCGNPADARAARSLRRGAAVGSAALLIAGLAACTTAPMPDMAHMQPPAPQVMTNLSAYQIQLGDELDIHFLLNPELNESVLVRPDGMISTAAAQDVPAYGKTPAQLAAVLRDRYKGLLHAPNPVVEVKSIAPTRLYVAGEVNAPGEFLTAGPPLSLVQAVARAGGVKLGSARDYVFIIRREADNKVHYLRTDYLGAITGRNKKADVLLASGDTVYVPRSSVYEVWTYWNEYVLQFVPLSAGIYYGGSLPAIGK